MSPALARSASSFALLMFFDGAISSTFGTTPIIAMPAKSLAGS